MERLTVNKPVSEMNMEELAYNCCYVSEDGSASYRDFQTDIDAREFVRRLMRIYNDEDLSEDDTAFDEEVIEELKYNPEIYTSALIALFYRNMWAMAKLRERLKRYEDAEEQGLLLRLPCKVGYAIYRINIGAKDPIIKMRVLQVYWKQLHKDRIIMRIDAIDDDSMGESCYLLEDIGETVFLTKEEAEQKLAEIRGDNNV